MTGRETISGQQATELIRNHQSIRDKVVIGTINLTELIDESEKLSLIIDNSLIEELTASSVMFKKQVILRSSTFRTCDFTFTYFLGGLIIADSIFESYLDFQCGGHNEKEKTIEIVNSTFNGFVNFFDCIYNGPMIIKNNRFQKGTNILGNQGKPFVTQFDSVLEINNNLGPLTSRSS